MRSQPTATSVGTDGQGFGRNWWRSIRFSGFAVLMVGILVLAVLILAPGLRTYLDQRQQVIDLRQRVAEQKAQVDALEAQRARWDDPTYIRAQARDRLFYVLPGETSYLIIADVDVDEVPVAPVSDTIQTTEVDWMQSLFTSVMTAGLSQQTASELPILDDGK